MARLRFFVLQVILAAGLAAAWLYGVLSSALAGDGLWFVTGILAIGAIGLVLIAIGRHGDAARLRDLLPVVAVCAMQLGMVAALSGMGQALMSAGDPAKAAGGFFHALSLALYVSVSALGSYAWLYVTIWLTGGEDA